MPIISFQFLLALLLAAVTLTAPAGEKGGPSYLQLARSYEQGRDGRPRDYRQALRLYCLAENENAAEAAYHLGWMHFSGRGVPRDMARAAWWFREAAAKGDRTAANLLKRLQDVEPQADPSCQQLLAGSSRNRRELEKWVYRLAPDYRLDPRLVLAVIEVESGFNPRARSPKGAMGLMQLMPQTARRFDVEDPWDPVQNLRGGMAYLRWLLDRFDGDLELVLAGYNAGEQMVERYQGVPPFRETRRYVQRITQSLEIEPAGSTSDLIRKLRVARSPG